MPTADELRSKLDNLLESSSATVVLPDCPLAAVERCYRPGPGQGCGKICPTFQDLVRKVLGDTIEGLCEKAEKETKEEVETVIADTVAEVLDRDEFTEAVRKVFLLFLKSPLGEIDFNNETGELLKAIKIVDDALKAGAFDQGIDTVRAELEKKILGED